MMYLPFFVALLAAYLATIVNTRPSLSPPLKHSQRLCTDHGIVSQHNSLLPQSICPGSWTKSLGRQAFVALDDDGSSSDSFTHLWLVEKDSSTLADADFVLFAWELIEDAGHFLTAGTWLDRFYSALSQYHEQHFSLSRDLFRLGTRGLLHGFRQFFFHSFSTDDNALSGRVKSNVEIIMSDQTFAVARIDSIATLLTLSTYVPRDTRLVRLLPQQGASNELTPLAKQLHNHTLPRPRFIPPLHSLLYSSALTKEALRGDARILTGEDLQGQRIPEVHPANTWNTRHSATYGARAAGTWLRERMQRDLSSVSGSCTEWKYHPEYAPNIVCTIPPTKATGDQLDNRGVLFSSHYDSRGSFGSTLAPGGNDDGSGTTMLLALARHIGQHQLRFEREVQLVAFSGEEQGLVGSQHYAHYLKEQNIPLRFQMQTDMIGYRKPGEPLQAAFPNKLSTQEATDYVMSIAKLYVPELQLGYTPACCSDHQSFWEQGFTSTWLFERRGPIADDRYHDSGDLTNRTGYDFDQIQANTRLVLATLLDISGAVPWKY